MPVQPAGTWWNGKRVDGRDRQFAMKGASAAAGGPASDALLLEIGDYLLLETGDYLLLE